MDDPNAPVVTPPIVAPPTAPPPVETREPASEIRELVPLPDSPPVVDPLAAVFDPTKPTIDQTRANAIFSIQQNFEALTPVAGIVPAQYLKKTGDTAANLVVGPGPLTIDGGAGGWSLITYRQANIQRFDTFCDSGTFYVYSYDDAATARVAMSISRLSMNIGAHAKFGVGGQPRVPGFGAITCDVQGTGAVIFCVQSTDTTAGLKITAYAGNVYIDSMYAYASGDLAAGNGIPMVFRTQDVNGNMQARLTLQRDGPMTSGVAAFVGGFYWLGGPAAFAPDFRTAQTIGIQPGSSITGVTMATGQVARIYINGPGSIPLPTTNWHLQAGGAVWGLAFTIINLFTHDGVQIFATFTPYDT